MKKLGVALCLLFALSASVMAGDYLDTNSDAICTCKKDLGNLLPSGIDCLTFSPEHDVRDPVAFTGYWNPSTKRYEDQGGAWIEIEYDDGSQNEGEWTYHRPGCDYGGTFTHQTP